MSSGEVEIAERPAGDLPWAAATELGDDPREHRANLVRQAVQRLSASAREIVVLRYFSGLSHEQIATVLGISAQAVHSRLCRARRKMADFLKRKGFGRREP